MPPDTQQILDTIPWSRLLRDIHNRQVLPIIGPGLVTVEENGAHLSFPPVRFR